MMSKMQNLRIMERSQRHPVLHDGLLKHISVAMNSHTSVGELFEAAFSSRFTTHSLKLASQRK
jgi:hypothetical protein